MIYLLFVYVTILTLLMLYIISNIRAEINGIINVIEIHNSSLKKINELCRALSEQTATISKILKDEVLKP